MADGSAKQTQLVCRIDTLDEMDYFKNGGILNYVLRQLAAWVPQPLGKGGPDISASTVPHLPVVAVTPDGERFAALVRRGAWHPVKLGGKHSAGTMVADVGEGGYILLKPGSGSQNPSAGDAESGASQAKREAAFWACAKALGLQAHVPEAHLLLLDGREYAAIRMLPLDYRTMNDLRQGDPNLPRRLYHLYRDEIHRWAVMDYVLGQVDRNAGNEMSRGTDVQLIDGGSAFAGYGFDPARDPSTFVPHYLRAGAPGNFDDLDPEGKLEALPRLPAGRAAELGTWIAGIDPEALRSELVRYGIDPGPTLARLQRLREACAVMPADRAVDSAWTI